MTDGRGFAAGTVQRQLERGSERLRRTVVRAGLQGRSGGQGRRSQGLSLPCPLPDRRPGAGLGGPAGPRTCPPRRRRRCGSRRPSAAPTGRWAAPGSGWCSSARGTARRSQAPRTAARCGPSRLPAAPPACWGAVGGLGAAERGVAGEPPGRGLHFLKEGREGLWAQARRPCSIPFPCTQGPPASTLASGQ